MRPSVTFSRGALDNLLANPSGCLDDTGVTG